MVRRKKRKRKRKGKRKKTAWDHHVAKTRRENPGLKFSSVLKKASRTYKGKGRKAASRRRSPTKKKTKKKRRSKPVGRRKKVVRKVKSFAAKIKPTLDKGAKALGYGQMFGGVAAYAGNPYLTAGAELVGEYYGGKGEGLLVAEGVKLLTGRSSLLSILLSFMPAAGGVGGDEAV